MHDIVNGYTLVYYRFTQFPTTLQYVFSFRMPEFYGWGYLRHHLRVVAKPHILTPNDLQVTDNDEHSNNLFSMYNHLYTFSACHSVRGYSFSPYALHRILKGDSFCRCGGFEPHNLPSKTHPLSFT